jgi:hypothetical protein
MDQQHPSGPGDKPGRGNDGTALPCLHGVSGTIQPYLKPPRDLPLANAHNCLEDVVAWLIVAKVTWKQTRTVRAIVAAWEPVTWQSISMFEVAQGGCVISLHHLPGEQRRPKAVLYAE